MKQFLNKPATAWEINLINVNLEKLAFVWMVDVQLVLLCKKVVVFATITVSTNDQNSLTMGW